MHRMWSILKKRILGFLRVLLLVTSRKIVDAKTRQVTLWWKMFKIVPWVVQMKADGQWPVQKSSHIYCED